MAATKKRPEVDPKAQEEAIITVRFLKAVANDNNTTPIRTIAAQNGVPPDAAETILNSFKHLMLADSISPDFPTRMLATLNKPLPAEGSQTETGELVERLTFEDIEGLKFIIKGTPESKKVMNQSTVRNLQDNLMSNNTNYGNVPPNPYQQQPRNQFDLTGQGQGMSQRTTMYSAGGGPGGGQSQQLEEDEDVALMRMILENNFNPRPHIVNRFCEMFRKFKHIWLPQPHKLLAALKANFQPSAGETAFMMYMDMRNQTIGDGNPQDLYRITGASQYSPVNPASSMGMGAGSGDFASAAGVGNGYGSQYAYGYGYPQMQAATKREMLEMEEDRRFNRQMEKMMKMNTMISMNAMSRNAATGGAGGMGMMNDPNYPGARELHEVVDPNTGRVVQRYYTSPQMPTNPADAGNLKMLEIMGQQNTALLGRLTQPDPIIGQITSKIFEASMDKADTMKQMSGMMEMMNNMRQSAGIGGPNDPTMGANSLKIAEMNNDMKLALEEMKMQHNTRQHEWDLQAAEAARAEENTQTFFKIAQEIGGRIVGPFAEKLAAGYAAKMGLGGAQEQAQEQQGQVPMGPMPQQQMMPMGPQQQMPMDPQMMEAMGYEVEKPGTVKLSPAQVETLKAERRHMTSQLKRLRKQQEEIEKRIQNRNAAGTTTTVVEEQADDDNNEEEEQDIAGEDQRQIAMIQSATNEQIDAAIRDVDQTNPAHRQVLNKLLAEKARRGQFQPQQKKGYAAITANVFQQRQPVSQQVTIQQEQEMYGVPERLIERKEKVVELPHEAIEEVTETEEVVSSPQGTVATPRNMAIQDEQTGTVAAIGAGGIKNQRPRSEQEEAAMMYGYGAPMSFGVSVNKDEIKLDSAGDKKKDLRAILPEDEEEINNEDQEEE